MIYDENAFDVERDGERRALIDEFLDWYSYGSQN